MAELKPCPFCGGKAFVYRFGRIIYSCYSCGCTLESRDEDTNDPEWNKRVPDQEEV